MDSPLELLYNIPPLDIHLREIGLATYVRLRPQLDKSWASKSTFDRSHLSYWEDLMKDSFIEATDDRCQEMSWDKKYHVILNSFTTNRNSVKPAEYNIYTDGSKTDNGVGPGFVGTTNVIQFMLRVLVYQTPQQFFRQK